jgi:hypothetical protein
MTADVFSSAEAAVTADVFSSAEAAGMTADMFSSAEAAAWPPTCLPKRIT